MALTAEEIVAAINAVPGITAAAITKTLTIGGLSTAISATDDAIANARAKADEARAALDEDVKKLIDQRDALIARRQALQNG